MRPVPLNETEEKIIRLICRQLTNKEIADKLNLSVRTIDTYRTNLVRKVKAKNTVGLVIYAIKSGLFKL